MNTRRISELDYLYASDAEAASLNPRVRSVLLDIRARYDAQRILGLGHSTQTLCRDLHGAGFTVASLETIAASNNESAEVAPVHQFNTADRHQRPVEGFDMAISIESKQSCVSLCQPVKLAAAHLRPDGVFILSTPYSSQMKNMLITLREQWSLPISAVADCGQMQCWSIKCMTVLLKYQGFKVMELIGVRDSSLEWDSLVLVARRTGLANAVSDHK